MLGVLNLAFGNQTPSVIELALICAGEGSDGPSRDRAAAWRRVYGANAGSPLDLGYGEKIENEGKIRSRS